MECKKHSLIHKSVWHFNRNIFEILAPTLTRWTNQSLYPHCQMHYQGKITVTYIRIVVGIQIVVALHYTFANLCEGMSKINLIFHYNNRWKTRWIRLCLFILSMWIKNTKFLNIATPYPCAMEMHKSDDINAKFNAVSRGTMGECPYVTFKQLGMEEVTCMK